MADPFDTYGTPEHEAWLIEMEREDDRRGPQQLPATSDFYGGCGCLVSQVYGGDCEHTVEPPPAMVACGLTDAHEAHDGPDWTTWCPGVGDTVLVDDELDEIPF